MKTIVYGIFAEDDANKLFIRKEVKIDVYGSAKPSNRKSNPIVDRLSQNIDLQQIVQQSASFAYFFEAFQVFLKKL